MKEDKVSVIIISSKDETYLESCIKSLINQTYKNIEIILITETNKKDLEAKYKKHITVHTTTNKSISYQKNYGLKKSKGKYIMFLDSRDFIEDITLKLGTEKINAQNSDLVFFDWKYFDNQKQKYYYVSTEDFFYKAYLNKNDKKELLNIRFYDIANKLYKKDFLIENNITYNESIKYEETEFWLKVIENAEKISLIHSPLYNLRLFKKNDKINIKEYIKTYNESLKIMSKEYKDLFNTHMINNFFETRKTVKGINKIKLKNSFYKLLKTQLPIKIYSNKRKCKFANKHNLLKNKLKFNILIALVSISNILRKTRKQLGKIKRNIKASDNIKTYNKYKNKPLKNQVLLVGFGWRYTGNNRYLFEELKTQNNNFDIYYAVNSKEVEEKYLVKPLTKEFYEKLYSSKIVIFESWIQNSFQKREDQIWINLWHGTPLKKVFFDSEEEEVTKANIKHKISKYKTTERIDYMLVDNKNISKYMNSAFLIPKEKILPYGYPRVKFLVNNKNNEKLKNKIREKLGVDKNKKIVSYLPTWRDYNFKKDSYDFNYLLDKQKLQELLGDDYVIKSKDHVYLSKTVDLNNTNIETQELLLVTDYLISDYSSVLFDSFAINTPVCIYANDYEKYEKSRGVYQEIWKDLSFCTTNTIEDLAKMIKNYEISTKYNVIKEKYCYNDNGDKLIEFIKNKLK